MRYRNFGQQYIMAPCYGRKGFSIIRRFFFFYPYHALFIIINYNFHFFFFRPDQKQQYDERNKLKYNKNHRNHLQRPVKSILVSRNLTRILICTTAHTHTRAGTHSRTFFLEREKNKSLIRLLVNENDDWCVPQWVHLERLLDHLNNLALLYFSCVLRDKTLSTNCYLALTQPEHVRRIQNIIRIARARQGDGKWLHEVNPRGGRVVWLL